MKKYLIPLAAIALALVVASCGSMPSPSLSGVVSAVSKGGDASGAIPAGAVAIEFQNGDILASNDTDSMSESVYYVGKITKSASAETKNQSEVLFVNDGKKYWCNYLLNSRKATKADFVVGNTVLVLRGWAAHDEISAENYRQGAWIIGNITSTDELFKNNVEVNGNKYSVKYVRVPLDPIK